MKLSVSAYQASSSSAQKILSQATHTHQLVPQHLHHGPLHGVVANYGSTSSTPKPSLIVPRVEPTRLIPSVMVEEVDGRSSPGADGGPSSSADGGAVDSAGTSGAVSEGGPAAPSSGRPEMVDSTSGRQTAVRTPTEATDATAQPPGKASKGAGKRGTQSSNQKEKKGEDTGEEGKKDKKSADKSPGLSDNRKSGDLEEIELVEEVVERVEGGGKDVEEGGKGDGGEARRRIGGRSKSVGEQHWTNVRAVMALYSRLRKIKRTKSNQRWMKLRTTVQLSGAISSTIQKKTPLKREDSFLKRFSTRQIPETQETMDTGDDGEDGGSSSAGGGGAGGGGGGSGGVCGGGGGGSSSHAMSDERRRRRRRVAHYRRRQASPRSVINPDENFYFYWLFVLTACVLYNLWTLIVRQSFPELQAGLPIFWRCGDAFGDTVFLLDVVVQFRTGYLEQGLMVYDSKKLATHYVTSRAFLLDLFALAPLDLVQLSPKVGPNPILRFPRFLKVYRLINYYYMVESRTVYPNLWRVINLVHILLILAHWFGCFYYLLSEAEGFQGDWVYPHRLEGDYATLTRKYLGSLYWSTLTLTTIGDLPTPETNAEYVFTIVSYLIGVFIFATIVGQVGNVITNRNANRLEFERLLDGAKTYMRHHKVPGDMKRRVLRWYDYSWSRGRIQGGGDINTALGLLPDKLKTELALHVNLSVLKKVTIFQECQPEFLHDLVLKMKAYIFTPGDLICRKGEVAREMFIIADGILEVMSETGRVLTTMKAGDFFGEIGILNLDGLNKRTADVRSVGYSELFSLSREDVLAAMKDYPEAQEILQSLGRKRLMEARNSSARAGNKKAISRSSTKVASSTSPTSTKSSPPVLDKVHSKDGMQHGSDKKESSRALQRQGSSSSSSPALLGTSMDQSVDADSGITGKKIVERLKSDVMGLRDVLRKSKRIASRGMGDEAIELQPLTKDPSSPSPTMTRSSQDKSPQLKALLLRTLTSSRHTGNWDSSGSCSGIKGALRRMSHVKSDDSGGETACGRTSPPEQQQSRRKRSRTKDQGSEDADGEEGDKSNEEQQPKMEVIGEGLPLLTRLRMLREKEERERKMREKRKSSKEEPEAEKREKPKEEEQESKSKPVEVIGEGLPLLTRLRMLREKEEREAAAAAEKSDSQPENGTRRKVSLAAVGTSAPTSPPPTTDGEVKSDPPKKVREAAPGRGKFLIQRLILQKAREEKEKEKLETMGNQQSTSQSHEKAFEKASSTTPSDATPAAEHLCLENGDGSSVNVSTTATTASQISVAIVPPRTRNLNQSECELQRDSVDRRFSSAEKGHLSEFSEEVQDTCTRTTLAQVPGQNTQTLAGDSVSINQDLDAQSTSASNAMSCVIVQVEAEEVGEGEMIGQVSEEPENELCSAAFDRKKEHRTAKPHMLHLRGEKNYISVDDLSPEYSGLPFVKKLKILNDRQRLAELDKSSSLDSGDCLERTDICYRNLSRSFSDASYISHLGPQVTFHGFDSHGPPQTLTVVKDKESDCDERIEEDLRAFSPESNETLERRNLKSILKKLSGSLGGEEVAVKTGTENSEGMTNNVGATARDLCQLMHAPTVEGYAARHSKLTKSVTFNRDTLASPPRTPTTTSVTPTSPVLFTPEASISSNFHEKPQVGQELSSLQQPSISNLNSTGVMPTHDRMHFIHSGSRDHREHREEYFEEVIFGIKQVIQNHLEEIQNKFQERFISLESEVKRRDEIISFLQRRIKELEEPTVGTSTNGNSNMGDDNSTSSSDEIIPFMRGDSADTVVSADLEEEQELDENTNRILLDHNIGVPRQRSKRLDKRKVSQTFSEEETMPAGSLSIWLGNRDGNVKKSPISSSSSSSFTSSSSSVSSSSSQDENEDDQSAGRNKDWEVQMLARELERRQGVKRLRDEDDSGERLERSDGMEEELESHQRLARRFLRLSRSERELLERLLGSDEEPDEDEACDRDEGGSPWHQSKSLKQIKKKVKKADGRRKGTTVSRRKNGSKSKSSLESKASPQDSSKTVSDIVNESKRRKVWIGQQVLNARSLEETGTSCKLPSPTSVSRRRAASAGQLPFLIPLPSLASLSNSFRGIAKAATAGVSQMSSQVSEPDPEKAVVTISGSGSSGGDCQIETEITSETSPVSKL